MRSALAAAVERADFITEPLPPASSIARDSPASRDHANERAQPRRGRAPRLHGVSTRKRPSREFWWSAFRAAT